MAHKLGIPVTVDTQIFCIVYPLFGVTRVIYSTSFASPPASQVASLRSLLNVFSKFMTLCFEDQLETCLDMKIPLLDDQIKYFILKL